MLIRSSTRAFTLPIAQSYATRYAPHLLGDEEHGFALGRRVGDDVGRLSRIRSGVPDPSRCPNEALSTARCTVGGLAATGRALGSGG